MARLAKLDPSPALRCFRPIERARAIPDEIAERIIMSIVYGEKRPGDRITEAEIAAGMNVSRVPGREAMQKLQLQGILEPSELRGMRVADFSDERINELYEVRLAIEKVTFRHAMRRARENPALLEPLAALLEEMTDVAGGGDHIAVGQLDVEFHRMVARIAQNKMAERIWEGLSPHLLIVFCREWIRAESPPEEVKLHRELLELLRSGVEEEIDPMLTAHIIGPHSLLLESWKGPST